MALKRVQKVERSTRDVAGDNVSNTWRSLVHPLDDEQKKRRHVQLWAWSVPAGWYLLLRPKLGVRTPVVALSLEASKVKNGLLDDVPATMCEVHWMQGGEHRTDHALLANAHFLRTWFLRGAELVLDPLPDSVWDYTRELPEAPAVTQPFAPGPIEEVRSFVARQATATRVAVRSPEGPRLTKSSKGQLGWGF